MEAKKKESSKEAKVRKSQTLRDLLKRIEADDPTLVECDMSGLDMRNTDAMKLAKALDSNSHLTKLDISQNKIRDVGASSLAKILRTNSHIVWIDISLNELTPLVLNRFDRSLQSNITLLYLGIEERISLGKLRLAGTKCPMVMATRLRLCRYIDMNRQYTAVLDNGGGRRISLNNRRLIAVPKTLFTVQNLHTLDLAENYLVHLSPRLSQVTALQRLVLKKNLLTDVSSFPFHRLPQLTVLDLKENLLATLPASLPLGCPNLTSLNVSNNRLADPLSIPLQLLAQLDWKSIHMTNNPSALISSIDGPPSSVVSAAQAASANESLLANHVQFISVGHPTDALQWMSSAAVMDEKKFSKSQLHAFTEQVRDIISAMSNPDVTYPWSSRQLWIPITIDGQGVASSSTLAKRSRGSGIEYPVSSQIECWNHSLSGEKFSCPVTLLGEGKGARLYQISVSAEKEPFDVLFTVVRWARILLSLSEDKNPSILVTVVSTMRGRGKSSIGALMRLLKNTVTNLFSSSSSDLRPKQRILYINTVTGEGMKSFRKLMSKMASNSTVAPVQTTVPFSAILEIRERLLAFEEIRKPPCFGKALYSEEQWKGLVTSVGLTAEDAPECKRVLQEYGFLAQGQHTIVTPALLALATSVTSTAWALPLVAENHLCKLWEEDCGTESNNELLALLCDAKILLEAPERMATGGKIVRQFLVRSTVARHETQEERDSAKVVRVFRLNEIAWETTAELIVQLYSSIAVSPSISMRIHLDTVILVHRKTNATAIIRVDPVLSAIVCTLWDEQNDISSAVYEAIDLLKISGTKGCTVEDVLVPCLHCRLKGKHLYEAHMFKLRQLATRAAQGETFAYCASGMAVMIAAVAPDLTFKDLSHMVVEENQFQLGESVGEGGFASVYKATLGEHHETVAAKVLNVVEDAPQEEGAAVFAEFRKEVSLMASLHHQNLVSLRGLCMKPICVFTEFCAFGDLRGYLSHRAEAKKPLLSIEDAVHILHDVAAGMRFLHDAAPPIVHRDLKSPNILLVTTPESLSAKELTGIARERAPMAKVADFGLSTRTTLPCKGRLVDNPLWLAPEVLKSEPYSTAADVYAFGIIMFEVFTARLPFDTEEYAFMYQLEDLIVNGARPEIPGELPSELRDLMERCWAPDMHARPNFDEIAASLERFRVQRCGLAENALSEASTMGRSRTAFSNSVFNPRLATMGSSTQMFRCQEDRLDSCSEDASSDDSASLDRKRLEEKSKYEMLRTGLVEEDVSDDFGYDSEEEPVSLEELSEEERKRLEAAAVEDDLVRRRTASFLLDGPDLEELEVGPSEP